MLQAGVSCRALVSIWALLALLLAHSEAQAPSQGRIAYGSKTISSSYPSYVALSDWGGGFICGGTLIAKNIVLTARHCTGQIQRATIGPLKLGGYENGFVKGGTTVIIKKKIAHPNYGAATYRNDIALLVLSKPLNGYKVAALAKSSPKSGSKLTVVGHGETVKRVLPSSLLRATMTVQSGSYCEGTDPGGICLQASRVAYGYNEICSGDSGGPAYSSPGVVAGVASYGLDRPCGRNRWSVFTDVAYYSKWIKSTMARYGGYGGSDDTASPLDDGGDQSDDGMDENADGWDEFNDEEVIDDGGDGLDDGYNGEHYGGSHYSETGGSG